MVVSEKELTRQFATENCKKAAEVYQSQKTKEKHGTNRVKSSQQKRISSKATRSTMKDRHIKKTSAKPSLPVGISTKPKQVKSHSNERAPSIKIVNHVARSSAEVCKRPSEASVKNPSFHSTSQALNRSHLASCVEPHTDNQEEEEEQKFHLLRDG